ncbi:MAG: hypothetical protein U0835_22315 [Isosphaeraceae bacterium]
MANLFTPEIDDPSDRPIAFLVSTTAAARGIRERLGSPAYSYHFVVEALAPVLERFGVLRPVDHPESRLAFAARQARREGFRPVHLAVNPLQDVYYSPHVPNVVFPFWEFPDLPDRDLGLDARQNWHRSARGASLILTACQFTADAFRRAGVKCPVAVVPVPLDPSFFSLPDWDPGHSWTLTCRHEILGPEAEPGPSGVEYEPRAEPAAGWNPAKRAFRRVAPWLDPHTVRRLTLAKRSMVSALKKRPDELIYTTLRDGYRRHVRRWLNPEALEAVSAAKRRALAAVGREPAVVPDPLLPSSPLTLSGLVYLTVFNVGDPRKNYRDILTACIRAFEDRPDVTLAIKLVTNPRGEHHETGVLRAAYRSLGMRHRCRIAVVTEFLDEPQMSELFRASTFYVNASHAEGACLPLMRALAGGRPAIAPAHTAMADYMDASLGWVVRSHEEPACWPHDPEKRLTTTRHRLVWTDLRDAFLASAETAEHSPALYHALSTAARARMQTLASQEAAAEALRAALALLPELATGRHAASA